MKDNEQVNGICNCCFVCDKNIIGSCNIVSSARTAYSKALVIDKLSSFIGNEFVVVVTENDYICNNCHSLFNDMDRLENNLENLKLLLSKHLNHKYGLFDNLFNFCEDKKLDLTVSGVKCNEETDIKLNISYDDIQPLKKISSKRSDLSTRKVFFCDVCGIKMHKMSFNRHVVKEHILREESFNGNCSASYIFTCRVCSSPFISLNSCKKHIKIQHLGGSFDFKLQKRTEACNKFRKLVTSNDSVNDDESRSEIKDHFGNNCDIVNSITLSNNDNELINLKDGKYVNFKSVENANISECKYSVIETDSMVLSSDKDTTLSNSIVPFKHKKENLLNNCILQSPKNNVNLLCGVELNCDKNTNLSSTVISSGEKNYSLFNCSATDVINSVSSFTTLSSNVNENLTNNFRKAPLVQEMKVSCWKCGKWVEKYCKLCKINVDSDKNEILSRNIFTDIEEKSNTPLNEGYKINGICNVSLHLDTVNYNEQINCVDNISNNCSNDVNSKKLVNENDNQITGIICRLNNRMQNTKVTSIVNKVPNNNLGTSSSSDISTKQNILEFVMCFNNNPAVKEEYNKNLMNDSASNVMSKVNNDSIVVSKVSDDTEKIENLLKSNERFREKDNIKLEKDNLNYGDDNYVNTVASVSIKTLNNINNNLSYASSIKLVKSSCKNLTKTNKLYCSLCSVNFSNELFFKEHIAQHVSVKQKDDNFQNLFSCFLCESTFTDINSAYLHTAHHSDWKSYYCFLCRCDFSCNDDFLKHCKSEHVEKKICTICGKIFKTESQFLYHIEFIHRRNLNCNVCKKSFFNLSKLKKHESNHNRKYVCDICNKILKTPTGLKVHKVLHTGQYTFVCEVCGKGFVSAHSFNEHKSKHTKEPRYICDVCGKKFCLYDTYHKHRNHHDNPYPKQCDICRKYFRSSSRLAEHKRINHTFERPYKCPYCPLSFHISNLLKYHLCIHTKQYPFTCSICKKGFPARNKYALHMLKKHKDDSFIKSRLPNNKERNEEWSKLSRICV